MAELRQLRVFVAVAEELNFTRAAERLFLGQQAVSKSVRQLERELGVSLLERSTREVRLTNAGAELLSVGRDLLVAADAAFDRAREVGRATAGVVRIGVAPALGRVERGAVVQALRADSPGLSVDLREVYPDGAAVMLRSRDVEIVVSRFGMAAADIADVALAPTPAALYVPAGHRLASRSQPVALRELDGERLLTSDATAGLLVARLAAEDVHVHTVQALVSGAGGFMLDVSDLGVVAIEPAGEAYGDCVSELQLEADLRLPLTVSRVSSLSSAAADRVVQAIKP